MKIFLLSTCDAWKSSASMQPYFLVNSQKTGFKRLLNVIREGIKKACLLMKATNWKRANNLHVWKMMPNKVQRPCVMICRQN